MVNASRSLWLIWEKVFHHMFRLEKIKSDRRNIFFIAKRTYLGRRFTVDGETVKPFDKVIELHMDNDFLMELLQSEQQIVGIAVRLLREVRNSMPALADILRQGRFEAVRAVYGVTFLHRGVARLGFTVLPVQNRLKRRATKVYLRHILKIVNPDAMRIITSHTSVLEPMLVAASKANLVARYTLHPDKAGNSMTNSDRCLT